MTTPLNLEALSKDVYFDKGSDLNLEFFYISHDDVLGFEVIDLSDAVAEFQVKQTYASQPETGWSFTSPCAELAIISAPGSTFGTPYSNIQTIWGVKVAIPASLTSTIAWAKKREYNTALFEIEITSPSLGVFKLIKGNLFAAEEVVT